MFALPVELTVTTDSMVMVVEPGAPPLKVKVRLPSAFLTWGDFPAGPNIEDSGRYRSRPPLALIADCLAILRALDKKASWSAMLVGVDAPLFGVVAAGVVPGLDGGTLEDGAGEEFKVGRPFGLGAGLLIGVELGDADGEGAGGGLEAGKEPVAPLRIAPL
jgi:hypothetical protein